MIFSIVKYGKIEYRRTNGYIFGILSIQPKLKMCWLNAHSIWQETCWIYSIFIVNPTNKRINRSVRNRQPSHFNFTFPSTVQPHISAVRGCQWINASLISLIRQRVVGRIVLDQFYTSDECVTLDVVVVDCAVIAWICTMSSISPSLSLATRLW